MQMVLSARQKEQFFHELTQLARSAVPLMQSFDILSRSGRSRVGHCSRTMQENLRALGSVRRAFEATGFPPSDAAVIEAGESTGRLDAVFAELESYYKQLADARQRIITRSIYPLVVLHLGAFLLAIPPAIIDGSFAAFLWNAIPILVGFYLLLGLVFLVWRVMRFLLANSPSGARLVMAIPGTGGFLSDWTAWKFTGVLSLYVRAGGGFLKGFETAGVSCGNALFREASVAAVAAIQAGGSLAEAVHRQHGWPELLERALEVGEHSGRLDEEVQRAAAMFMTRTLGRLQAFSVWTPRVIYLGIVLLMGWRIISLMMATVYGPMKSMLDGRYIGS